MKEDRRTEKLKWFAIIDLLIPPISFLVIFNLKRLPEFIEMILLGYVAVCLVFPLIFGIYLLVKYFQVRSGLILFLSILNMLSPVWLLFFLLYLVLRKGGNLLPMT